MSNAEETDSFDSEIAKLRKQIVQWVLFDVKESGPSAETLKLREDIGKAIAETVKTEMAQKGTAIDDGLKSTRGQLASAVTTLVQVTNALPKGGVAGKSGGPERTANLAKAKGGASDGEAIVEQMRENGMDDGQPEIRDAYDGDTNGKTPFDKTLTGKILLGVALTIAAILTVIGTITALDWMTGGDDIELSAEDRGQLVELIQDAASIEHWIDRAALPKEISEERVLGEQMSEETQKSLLNALLALEGNLGVLKNKETPPGYDSDVLQKSENELNRMIRNLQDLLLPAADRPTGENGEPIPPKQTLWIPAKVLEDVRYLENDARTKLGMKPRPLDVPETETKPEEVKEGETQLNTSENEGEGEGT